MNTLIDTLRALGFTRVLGTFQDEGGERVLVVSGKPKRHAENNGVTVVYDETGAPWVTSCAELKADALDTLIRDYDLKAGAHVPHSNDGGRFINGSTPASC